MWAPWEPHLLLGTTINGRYRLLEPFARGGMGVVFRAVDVRDGQPVAVKVLHSRHALEPEMIRRFCVEADALAGIDHPSVVRIIESGVEPGLSPWIAMELVEGEDLGRRLQRGQSRGDRGLPLEEVLAIGLDIAGALVAVHALGLVHRDVKPSNIVTHRVTGRSKLVDFGISKRVPGEDQPAVQITLPGAFVGTEDYAAPEQHAGEAGPPADVYSLALTLAEALGGGSRRDEKGEYRGWPNVLRGLIARGEPDRLIELLARALDDRPEARPAAIGLRAGLEEIARTRASTVAARRPVRRADPDAETRPPQPRDTEVDRPAPATAVPSRERESPRTAILVATAAAVAVAVAWAIWASGVRTPPAPTALAPAVEPDNDMRYTRVVRTQAAISELAAAFARDVKAPAAVRDAHLRYDCARLERLGFDVEGVEHPIAYQGRAKLAELATTYAARCESVRGDGAR